MRLFFSVVVGVCLFGGWFCVFVCVVVLGPFLFSNCLIPSSSHKSCGDFQVLVKGHWTYSWAYVWVCQVSHFSLTWTAGTLEISCSLRGKKIQWLPNPGQWLPFPGQTPTISRSNPYHFPSKGFYHFHEISKAIVFAS